MWNITSSPRPSKLADLSKYIDHSKRTIVSTTGELKLDYGKGLLTINASAAQGASGLLADSGPIDLKDLSIRSDMPLGHIVVVSLDDKPLAKSSKMLLQVMSEEKSSGFQTEPTPTGLKKIVSIGRDPQGVTDASPPRPAQAAPMPVPSASLTLDPNGEPIRRDASKAKAPPGFLRDHA